MTLSTEFDSKVEMRAFIDRSGAPYGDWYVGLAADPEARLEEHGVEQSDWFIVRRLAGEDAAVRVEESLRKADCEGAQSTAGEDEDEVATAVYAYWKRAHTTP